MATINEKPRPRIFEGTGSAIDDYFKPASEKPNTENWALFNKNNQQHKNILSLLRQAQWTTPHPNYGQVADLERLSNFLKSEKSPVKKPLKEMKPEEVSKIIVALEGIVKSRYK